MKSIFKSAAIPVIIGVSLAIGTTACSHAQRSAHPVPSAERSQAKAGLKQVTAKCIPASAGAQVQLAHSVLTKAGRQALVVKCGIPPHHKAAFEAQVLNAAEHGRLTTKGGRTKFFTVTLPQIVVRNQA